MAEEKKKENDGSEKNKIESIIKLQLAVITIVVSSIGVIFIAVGFFQMESTDQIVSIIEGMRNDVNKNLEVNTKIVEKSLTQSKDEADKFEKKLELRMDVKLNELTERVNQAIGELEKTAELKVEFRGIELYDRILSLDYDWDNDFNDYKVRHPDISIQNIGVIETKRIFFELRTSHDIHANPIESGFPLGHWKRILDQQQIDKPYLRTSIFQFQA